MYFRFSGHAANEKGAAFCPRHSYSAGNEQTATASPFSLRLAKMTHPDLEGKKDGAGFEKNGHYDSKRLLSANNRLALDFATRSAEAGSLRCLPMRES